MAKYNSRRPEMLNRLYEEGRSNKEYRTEFEDVRYERAIARLPEQERLEAIERIIYKRLCKYYHQSFFPFIRQITNNS